MAQSVDAILDDAADGLKYFEQFIEEYKRAYGGYYKSHELSYLYMRYDEQRGMDLAKLSAAATGLQSALKDADQEWTTQNGLAQQLPNLWQGEAATSARDMFGKQLSQAFDDKTKSRAVLDAITKQVSGLQLAVQAKADVVKGLLGAGGAVLSGGKTQGEVDTIISGSKMGTTSNIFSDDLIRRLQGVFPDQKPFGSFGATMSFYDDSGSLFGVFDGDSGYGKRLKDRCQEWLDKVFKPDFEGKVDTFLAHCDTTNTTIEQSYSVLVQAAQQLTHKPFVRPAGTTAPASPGPSPSPGPSSPSPSSPAPSITSGGPSTTPTTNTPGNTNTNTSSFDPSALMSQASSALNGLGSFSGQVSSLGQTFGQEASSLSTTIQQGVQGVISQFETLASGSTGNKPKLEFDVAGKHVKFELGKNGEVDMNTSDSDGDSKNYSMKLDEHGIPVITSADSSNKDDDSKKDDDKSESDRSGTDSDKPAESGSGSGDSRGSGGGKQNSGGSSSVNQHSGGGHNTDSPGSGNQSSNTTPAPETGASDKDKTQTPASDQHQQPAPGTDNDSGAELAEAGPL